MKKRIRSILVIISVMILVLGILSAIGLVFDLFGYLPTRNAYVDGTDFSGAVDLFVGFGSAILGFLVILWSIIIDAVIWAIYGIAVGAVTLIKKYRAKTA